MYYIDSKNTEENINVFIKYGSDELCTNHKHETIKDVIISETTKTINDILQNYINDNFSIQLSLNGFIAFKNYLQFNKNLGSKI